MGERRVALPRWPSLFLALLATLAIVSLAQGIVDVLVPTLTGETPFGFLFGATQQWGPVFFALYIFAHNLGLACLVPGIGFVAAWFEKEPKNRGRIGLLLAGSVVVSLLVGLEFLIQSSERFDPRLVFPLFALEALGVLLLAIPAARMLHGFVPTRHYDWSLMTPMRRLSPKLVVSALVLAVGAFIETWVMLVA